MSILKSLFPSVTILFMNSVASYEVYIEDILDSFIHLESLAIHDHIECYDTNRSYPKLKHLFLKSVSGAKLPSLPSLGSLRMNCNDFSKLKPWMEKNFGRPSKRCELVYPYCGSRDYSFQLSSLPSSLEYLKTGNFFGYKRRFEPMFPKLMEVSREQVDVHIVGNIVDCGHTQFIDFLKDHSLTLKKMTTDLYSFDDEQLKDMLSCLRPGTHIKFSQKYPLKRADKIRQYGLIGGLCRDRNLYLEIWGYYRPNIFWDILPPETQLLTLYVSHVTHSEASCRKLIEEIFASPVRSTTLLFDPTEEEYKRTWSTAIQGLPETHEAIFECFEPKPQRVIILRRN